MFDIKLLKKTSYKLKLKTAKVMIGNTRSLNYDKK